MTGPVSQPSVQQMIRALGEDGRAGALDLARHAVAMFLASAPTSADRSLSLDILARDMATLRGVAPHLAGFIAEVEAALETHAAALRTPLAQAA